jgi:hypothetical protein
MPMPKSFALAMPCSTPLTAARRFYAANPRPVALKAFEVRGCGLNKTTPPWLDAGGVVLRQYSQYIGYVCRSSAARRAEFFLQDACRQVRQRILGCPLRFSMTILSLVIGCPLGHVLVPNSGMLRSAGGLVVCAA